MPSAHHEGDSSGRAEAGIDVDLEFAADVFLRGPSRSGGMQVEGVHIGSEAVLRIARTLASCSPSSVGGIRRAVAQFRNDPTWHARDSVIESVTWAAATLPTTMKES